MCKWQMWKWGISVNDRCENGVYLWMTDVKIENDVNERCVIE